MKYFITYDNPLQRLLNIKLTLDTRNRSSLEFELPIWRPGRYEAANYAKNIQKIGAESGQGHELPIQKLKPSRWEVQCKGANEVSIQYRYYAHEMDAGNSFLDERMVYINFINCLLYVEDRMNETHEVVLDLPQDYSIACGLKHQGHHLRANSYYELVDSPMIASSSLDRHSYEVDGYKFHIWIQGKHNLDMKSLVAQFAQFTQLQIEVMGDFPVPEYHFLFHILPYKHYHGVEHGASTVITLGPSEEVNKKPFYNELLGVSSHELFHTWNILKIRPVEMMPYHFGQPPVFPTGFVAEGFTTYYGDLFLKRSGVFSMSEYLFELEKLFSRHFLNRGRLSNSVYDSSVDLWFDGYQPGAPHKKSSIYIEGAVLALLLDLQIRLASEHERSLDDVMRILWDRFGKVQRGYSYDDIIAICEEVMGSSLNEFFNTYVKGTTDTKTIVTELLSKFGLNLSFVDRSNILERALGIILVKEGTNYNVVSIAPKSAGENYFSVRDQIKSINDEAVDKWLEKSKYETNLVFDLVRDYQPVRLPLKLDLDSSYFKEPRVKKIEQDTEVQFARKTWLHT
ncbi:MAG: M61 family peptidase [Bacteroidota bacterium]